LRTGAHASANAATVDAVRALRKSRRDLAVFGVVALWIAAVLGLDRYASIWPQRGLGLLTWVVLLALLRGESRRVRAQVAIVVAFATCIEYAASPLLGVYTYRLHNVPAFVPPGHGMVYLAALALGRSALFDALRRPVVYGTLVAGGLWAAWGLLLADRNDAFGAILYLCLARFLLVGRAPAVYAGAFVITTYLELIGTRIGTWTWSQHDPTGLFGVGNPPSGIPGGYCFFDAAALAGAPALVRLLERLRRPHVDEPLPAPAPAG
jgi:hypothetical protein